MKRVIKAAAFDPEVEDAISKDSKVRRIREAESLVEAMKVLLDKLDYTSDVMYENLELQDLYDELSERIMSISHMINRGEV